MSISYIQACETNIKVADQLGTHSKTRKNLTSYKYTCTEEKELITSLGLVAHMHSGKKGYIIPDLLLAIIGLSIVLPLTTFVVATRKSYPIPSCNTVKRYYKKIRSK
jgi:hypothetical protein